MSNDERRGSLKPGDAPSTDAASKPETTKLPEASSEVASPAAPVAIEKPETVGATEKKVDPNKSASSLQGAAPQADNLVPLVLVEPVVVKKRQSFFDERPLPVIEMAPRLL